MTPLFAPAWVLIVWATAVDGLPTLPITIEPKVNFQQCDTARRKALQVQHQHAVCRPILVVKSG